MPIQNSSPSSAAQVVGAAAIFRLAVHGGASSLAVDAHQLSRSLHLPDYLNILGRYTKMRKQTYFLLEKVEPVQDNNSYSPLGREGLAFALSPRENLTHSW